MKSEVIEGLVIAFLATYLPFFQDVNTIERFAMAFGAGMIISAVLIANKKSA